MIGEAGATAAPLREGAELLRRYREIRAATARIAEPLSPEDCTSQSMPEASPIRWHLAHTSWFFETFVLASAGGGYEPFHPAFSFLFNSYYDAIGDRVPRPMRGRITRPGLEEIREYRRHVDRGIERLLARGGEPPLLELGLQHEQQHQELMLTDLKHLFSLNPLCPAYRISAPAAAVSAAPLRYLPFEGGIHSIGRSSEKPGAGFAFDNEGPRHRVLVQPFELASRPVTNGEYLAFVEDGGYRRPEHWLSDGWDWVVAERIEAPLYWRRESGRWLVFTLGGLRDLDPAEPVAHVGGYEAAAFARYAGARLPREEEWEIAAAEVPVEGNFAESGAHHPRATPGDGSAPSALFGDVWEWTQSPYVAYPGFRPPEGAIGEYNGKFMSGRLVLRGGSCASPRSHLRASYRNFFVPTARWQFSGVRLARDV